MRRFTRLTNGYSKTLANHVAAVHLHFLYYNFCRINQRLRVTPAMAAGLSQRVWDISDIVALLRADREQSGLAAHSDVTTVAASVHWTLV